MMILLYGILSPQFTHHHHQVVYDDDDDDDAPITRRPTSYASYGASDPERRMSQVSQVSSHGHSPQVSVQRPGSVYYYVNNYFFSSKGTRTFLCILFS